MKKSYAVLWILFIVFIAARVMFTMPYWVVLTAWTCGLSIALLRRAGKPSKKYIAISVLFAVVSTAAYLGYRQDLRILLYGIRAGLPTFLCSLAVFSVMEKRGGYELVSRKGKHPLLVSILIAVVSGALLSVINFFLDGEPADFKFSLWKVLLSLNPAVYEEMACRAIFMAFCVWYAGGEMNFFQKFTMYFMMCVPHTVVHGYPLIETIVLCVLFGLPFAVMQRKRDITTAMVSHGIVDLVRFTLTGV